MAGCRPPSTVWLLSWPRSEWVLVLMREIGHGPDGGVSRRTSMTTSPRPAIRCMRAAWSGSSARRAVVSGPVVDLSVVELFAQRSACMAADGDLICVVALGQRLVLQRHFVIMRVRGLVGGNGWPGRQPDVGVAIVTSAAAWQVRAAAGLVR